MATFTKQAICASFIKLLRQKAFDKITVKDIVDDCSINRKTFYYYYQDIYALCDEVFQMRLQEINEKLPPDKYSWRDAMKSFAEYLYSNQKITMQVFKSLGYEKLEDIFFDASMRYFPGFVQKQADGLTISAGDMNRIATYASITASGILTKWIRQGMKTVPEETIGPFAEIMNGCVKLALENADRRNGQK